VKTPLLNRKTRLFPCCVCREPREVRTTKKVGRNHTAKAAGTARERVGGNRPVKW
jgi:hypothetical protein